VTLEPCIMCLGAAFTARMGRVVHALRSPSDGGCEAFADWDRRRKRESMPGYAIPVLEGAYRARQAPNCSPSTRLRLRLGRAGTGQRNSRRSRVPSSPSRYVHRPDRRLGLLANDGCVSQIVRP
jgi:tRNA(adenine34) deaminase